MADTPSGQEPQAGWAAFSAALATARAELAAAAPDAATAGEVEAYLMRTAASTLSDGFLGDHFRAGGLVRAIPTRGGPNPDYQMWHAPIDATRRYRLEGWLNASERAGVGLYTIGEGGVTLLAGYAAFDRSNVDGKGRFSLELAADASGPGALTLRPEHRVLLVRLLHRAPDAPACRLKLTGGSPFPPLTPAMGSSEAALALASRNVLTGVRQFLEWSRLIGESRNRFSTPPPSIAASVQGDPDTGYYFAAYDLGAGEWLETLIPAEVEGYWSLHAYTYWCESLPGAGVHDLSATAGPDGRIRVRIGPDVPEELANRVDTQGRRRGVLIYRTIGERETRIPEAEVRSSL